MTSHKFVVSVLLLIGLLSAFNIGDYLYPSEKNAAVSYTNFTSDGASYSIVSIGGVQSLLLRNNELVTNQSEMETALHSYYIKSYYPSDTELSDLRAAIKRFNDSRNNGYDFKNKEEYTCRDEVLLSNGKISIYGQPARCTDPASCRNVSMLLFSIFAEGLNLGSAEPLYQGLINFTPYSIAMDGLLANYSTRLDNMNEDNLLDTINYIKTTSPLLKNYSLKIESTFFRTPRLNDSADRAACTGVCWGLCPSFDLDQAAAEAIRTQAEAIAKKIEPLQNSQQNAAQLYKSFSSRLEYVKTESAATSYANSFAKLNKTGAAAITVGQESVKRVKDTSLQANLDRLVSLHSTIPEDIRDRNLSHLDVDIAEYAVLMGRVNSTASVNLQVYEETREKKNSVDSLVLVLDSKDLDPASAQSFELLKNRTDDLDVQFRDGLTTPQLEALRSNYSEVESQAQLLIKSESNVPATKAVLLFRGFARRVNTGIAAFAANTKTLEPTSIPDNGPTSFGAFSALIFLSLSSMALLFSLYLLTSFGSRVPKAPQAIASVFACMVVLILVFSFFVYLFLGKTSTNATISEFLADFDSKPAAVILVDLRNTSYSDSQSMTSCAQTLATSLGGKNKSWSVYTLGATTCKVLASSGALAATNQTANGGSMSVSDCLAKAGENSSSFLLDYSPQNEPPRFSIIYQNKAEISANSDYYRSCPLVSLFN